MAFDERNVTGQWDYSLLPNNVQLGSDCWLERRDSFTRFRSQQHPGLRLGDRVRVFTWTAFNIEPTGWVDVGDDATLVGAVFMCAGHIRIGRQVTVSYHVTLADSDFHPLDPQQRQQDAVANSPRGDRQQRPTFHAEPITIGDRVSIGIGAMVLKGVTIGEDAVIEAGAVVTRDVPPGAVVAGNPARAIESQDPVS